MIPMKSNVRVGGANTLRAPRDISLASTAAPAPRSRRREPASADRHRAFAGMLASVLLGFAALLAVPQAAHAVDKEIFSRTLTVGSTSTSTTLFGFQFFSSEMAGSEFGSNTQRTIPELEGGRARYITKLTNDNASGGTLALAVTAASIGETDLFDTAAFNARLTLHVGTDSFAFADATRTDTGNSTFVWSSTGLTWAASQTYTVRLTLSVPGIDSIAFNSPATGTTYDTGESVTATVTFDEAVTVTGTPQLTINVGGTDKVLDYSSGSGTTALVFSGYTVAFGDTDADGLSIDANELDLNGGTIRATAGGSPDAVLTHTAVAASSSHKVSGTTVLSAPTVSSIAFNSAGTDLTFKTGDAVTATVTFSETVNVVTSGGTPQLTINVGGSDKVLEYASGTGTAALVFSGYTVAANDEDTDGISIAANKLDDNDGTIKATAGANLDAVLTHAAVAASANHKVDGVKPTLVTTGDDAPKTSLDGRKVILKFNETLSFTNTSNFNVEADGNSLFISSSVKKADGVVELPIPAYDRIEPGESVTVALDVGAVADSAGNTNAALSATTVVNRVVSPPGKPTLTLAAKDQSIDATVAFTDHGTSDITKYQYHTKTTGSYGAWTDSTENVSNTGGTFTIGGLTNATEYTVQVRGVNSDGNGAASDEASGTPDAPPAVKSIAITSDPGTDKTYIIGDDIDVTLTFDKNITLTGTGADPYIEGNIGTKDIELACTVGTAPTKDAVCTHTVDEGYEDSNGVDVLSDSLTQTEKMIVGPLGQIAVLTNPGLAEDSDHKVDGIQPKLSRADADPNDLTKIILTFSEAIGTVDNTKITVKKGGTDQTTTGAAIDSTDSTKVEITLMTALLSTDTNITVDLAADAVTDVPGNGNVEDLAVAVSLEDNTAPTLSSAGTYAIDGTGTGIALQFNETIAASSIPTASAFAAKIAGTAVTVASVAHDSSNTDTVNLVLGANPKAGDAVTVSYTVPGSNPLKDEAGNDVASFTDEAVTNNAAAPGKPTVTVAAKDASLEVTVAFTAHGTHNITKYQYQVKTTGSFGTWTDSTENVSNTGGTFTIGGLTNGTAHTVKVRGVSAAGNGAESDEASGTPDAPPAITSVAITSDPGTDKTYIIGDSLKVTVTFDKNITLSSGTGSDPGIVVEVGSASVQLPCPAPTPPTMELVCNAPIKEDDEDSDGISFPTNGLTTSDKMIVGPLGQTANLRYSAVADDSNHKVDAVKPTLSAANASGDLTKVVLTFSEAIGTVDNTKITVKKGGTDQTTTGAAIDSTNTTKVEITLMTALLSTDTNITVDLVADAVTDVPGNGIAEVLGTAVSVEDNVPPTLSSAGTYAIDGTGTGIALQFNETIAASSIPTASAFAAKIAGTAVTVASVAHDSSNTDTVNLVLGANPKAGDAVTVSYTVPGSNPLKDEAGNDVASFTDEAVTNNAAAPGKPTVTVAAKDASLEVTVAFTAHGTHNITKYQYQVKTTGSFGAWTDSTENVSNTGGTFTIGGLTNGTAHTVKVRGVSAAGNGAESDEASGTPEAAPTVNSIVFNSAGNDGAFKTGDAVTATVTFSQSVTVDTTDGMPQLTIKMGGSDKVLDYASGSPGTALVFSGYTVAASDEDNDGLSIEANKLDANGGTIKATADATVNAVLTHAAVAASANHKVDGVKPTLVTTGDKAPKTTLDGSQIILVFSEAIGSVDRTKITVKVGTTTETTTADSINGTKVEITLTTALASTATNITVALSADAVADVPDNGIAAVSATSVTRILPPGKPTLTLAAKDQSIDATVVFTAHGTSNITKYQYRTKTTGSYGAWTDSTENVSNTGGTFTIGGLTNGTEYTVEARGVNSDGDGAESDAAMATPNAPPAVSSVAITSDPGTDKTYAFGEDIVVTVIFDKNITLGTGTDNPDFLIVIGTNTVGMSCVLGTPMNRLLCTTAAAINYLDTNGVEVEQNSIVVTDKPILGPLGQHAVLTHSGLPDDSNHKVDAVKPTLSSANASGDLTKVVLTFSEAIGTVDNTKITVKKGGTDQTTTGAAIDSTNTTKVEITLMTALLSTDTAITVDLAADAVTDVPGNGIVEVLGTAVSLVDNVPPTFVSAGTNDTDEVVLTYSETLNTTQPATSDFTVKVGGNNRGVDTVAISGSAVTLTLASAFRPGDSLTVSYTKPGTNPIKDAADNEADSLAETAVTNNLAATAPEAPPSLVLADENVTGTANLYGDRLGLIWTTPWHNGSDITKYQYRYAEGTSVPATTGWTDIPDSAPTGENSNFYKVDGLDSGTQYTFEVRAVNGIGGGGEKASTDTTLSPAWSFTLRDSSNNNVTELTEGGDPATATVSITNNVRFSTEQTVTLEWGGAEISSGLIQGAGGSATFTIAAEQASGSLTISAPDRPGDLYRWPETATLTASIGGTQVGDGIEFEFVDDEAKPVATMVLSPDFMHSRGVSRMTVVEGDAVFPLATTNRGYDILNHPGVDAEVTGSASKFQAGAFQTVDGKTLRNMPFNPASATQSLASSLTTNDNSTAGDHSEHVFTIVPNPDFFTIGTPSSATLIILDNDAAPTAPRNLRAQARDGAVVLTWDPPTSLATTEFTAYELRHVAGSSPGGTFADISTDPETGSHTVTGLTNETEYTFELRAKNSFGSSGPVSVSKTPRVGPTVTDIRPTSIPPYGHDDVYGNRDVIEFRVTFEAAVDITGTPQLELDFDGDPKLASCTAATNTTTMVCSYRVARNDSAPNGILIAASKLTLNGGTIYVTGTTNMVDLANPTFPVFAGHKVDAVRPTLVTTGDDAPTTSADGTEVILTFSEEPRRVNRNLITIEADGITLSTTAESRTGTQAAITLATALTATATNLTVTLRSNAVFDIAGNGILGVQAPIINAVTPPPSPPPPEELKARRGDGEVRLEWVPGEAYATDPDLAYQLRYGPEGGELSQWEDIPRSAPGGPNAGSYTVTGLRSGTRYAFELRLRRESGVGEEEAEIKQTPETPRWSVSTNRRSVHEGEDVTLSIATSNAVGFYSAAEPLTLAVISKFYFEMGADSGDYEIWVDGNKVDGGEKCITVVAHPDDCLEQHFDLEVPVGSTSLDVTVKVLADGQEEDQETMSFMVFRGEEWVNSGPAWGETGVNIEPSGLGVVPQLAVADAEATEGEDPSLDFVVTLAPAAAFMVTVDYATEDGTATAGADYTGTNGTLTFAVGETEKTVSVPVMDDTVEDTPETLTLKLSNAEPPYSEEYSQQDENGNPVLTKRYNEEGVLIVDAVATGTIRNTEDQADPRTVSVSDASAAEGDSVVFTVSLSAASDRQVTVDYATSGGTATSGTDFTAESGTLTFAANETSKTLSVATTDDSVDEENETFTLTLTSPTNATLDDATATGTIRDNDTTATPLTASFKNLPGTHDGSSEFTFQVEFSEDVGISYGVLRDDGFTVTEGDVTGARRVNGRNDLWEITVDPDGQGDVTITLPGERACGETGAVCTRGEDPRPLSNSPSATVAGPAAAVTPTVGIADASGTEGDGDIAFTVTLDSAGTDTVTVDYATSNGTADGDDYTATSGTLTFDAGTTIGTITVPISDDDVNEGDETFTVTLSNASGATLGTASATGTIRNRYTPTVSISGGGGKEGDDDAIAFAVSLGRAATATVTIDYATSNGSATAGDDYTATSGTLSFAAGETGKTVSVPIADDNENESDETFTVTLSNASGAVLGTASATGTIENRHVVPLTASFEQVPAEHDGTTFVFHVRFSEDPAVSYLVLREESFDVTGGKVDKALRKDGRDDLREIHVEPSGNGDVTVSLPPTTDCNAKGAICTADDRPLSNANSATVRAMAALSAADAEATEGAGATLEFAVTLSRAASGTVTVGYATSDGTAVAGSDYTSASGTLTFDPGETAGTVSVTVLDDSVDDGGETLTLTLSNPSGARIADATATGTINNADPVPLAWLVRFGRTASDHAVEAIGARFEDSAGGSHATFAGRRLWSGGAETAGDDAFGFGGNGFGGNGFGGNAAGGMNPSMNGAMHTGMDGGMGMNGGPQGRIGMNTGTSGGPQGRIGMNTGTSGGAALGPPGAGGYRPALRDLLIGSSFLVSAAGADEAGAQRRLTAWGRAAATRFDGVADGVSVDGEVATFLVGADAAWNRWLAGVSVAYSVGAGGFGGADGEGGEMDSTLTAVHPYVRYQATDRLSAWGVLGYGGGSLRLETDDSTWRTDASMSMAAAGLRGVLLSTDAGLELAARTDVRFTHIASGEAVGNAGLLGKTAGGAHRVRLLLEGTRPFAFGSTRMLTPTLELGVRRDGGDAETGAGFDLGGSLRYADAALGLTVEATGRTLLAHEDAAYKEWGASISVRVDPGASGHGLTLSVTPSWGADAAGGAERLWSVRDARGLAGHGFDTAMRLRAEVGYGLSAFRGRGAAMPFAGVSTTVAGRDWRAGARWTRGQALEISLEAVRRESAGAALEHGIAFRLAWRPGARGPARGAADRLAEAAGDHTAPTAAEAR